MARKDYYICPVCRHKNEDTKKYCDNCGTWLLSETFPAVKYQRKRGGALRTIGKVLGYTTLAVLIILGALIYWASNTDIPEPATAIPEAEYQAAAVEIDYETLARNSEKMKGQRVKLHGKVTAITERGNRTGITLAMTEKEFFWDDFVFLYYTRPAAADRI